MSHGMNESRILSPHRPRRQGLVTAIEVTEHGAAAGPARWMGGADISYFGQTLHNLDLTACDFAVTGWEVTEGDSAIRKPFTSVLSAECTHLSGEEVLTEQRASLQAEHRALLPYLVETELLLGQTSGLEAQSLSDLATRDNPSSSLSGVGILGWAEDHCDFYESIIAVPIGAYASATGAGVWRDGAVWRTHMGNIVVPHAAGQDVYVIPVPIKMDLMWGVGPSGTDTVHTRNIRQIFSTVSGLFEIHADVVVFDPQP